MKSIVAFSVRLALGGLAVFAVTSEITTAPAGSFKSNASRPAESLSRRASRPRVTVNGPASKYYLTAGAQGMNWVVQNGAVVNSWPQQHPEFFGEHAIAVAATVRTLGCGCDPHPGSEYTLAGVYTGTNYPYPPVALSELWDGTTDGTSNYSIDYVGGGVYSFASDWTNPVLLFTLPGGYLGVAYDFSDGTLWVSQYDAGNGNTVEHRSLTGTLLSSFTVPFNEIIALALDPADGTLWMGTQTNNGTFYQYSKAGVQLSTVAFPELANQSVVGGDFAPPPKTFAQWQQTYFTPQQLADPAISGDSADPDHDGLSNLLEYAFHLDPTQPSTTNRPYTTLDATYVSLVYVKVLAETDLTYAIQQSTDLVNWAPVTPVNDILADDGITQTIKAKVPRSNAGSGGKLFLRLSVSH